MQDHTPPGLLLPPAPLLPLLACEASLFPRSWPCCLATALSSSSPKDPSQPHSLEVGGSHDDQAGEEPHPRRSLCQPPFSPLLRGGEILKVRRGNREGKIGLKGHTAREVQIFPQTGLGAA